jgi:hypothetical protein
LLSLEKVNSPIGIKNAAGKTDLSVIGITEFKK